MYVSVTDFKFGFLKTILGFGIREAIIDNKEIPA